MDGYSFWQDVFDTYQSLPDWLKALWMLVPPAFVLALTWLLRRPRREVGRLVYTIYRDDEGRLQLISHVPQDPPVMLPPPEEAEVVLPRVVEG